MSRELINLALVVAAPNVALLACIAINEIVERRAVAKRQCISRPRVMPNWHRSERAKEYVQRRGA
jgi:hypothetical protein